MRRGCCIVEAGYLDEDEGGEGPRRPIISSVSTWIHIERVLYNI